MSDPRRPPVDPFRPNLIDRRTADELRRNQARSEAIIVTRERVSSARRETLLYSLISVMNLSAAVRGPWYFAIAAVAFGVIAGTEVVRWFGHRRDLRALTGPTSRE